MSQKLILVKYELEDEIPIDESSENLQSAYAPADFIEWLLKNKFSSEMEIKESTGKNADIPITKINDTDNNCLEISIQYVEAKLIRCIEDAYSHISSNILVKKEIESEFSILHTWLNLRAVLKEKQDKYRDSHDIKLIIG